MFGIRDLRKVLKHAMKEVARTVAESELSIRGETTGSVALVKGGTVVMAHVGGYAIALRGKNKRRRKADAPRIRCKSLDHHLDAPEAQQKLEQVGSCVKDLHVVDKETRRGLLMARSIGDATFRKLGCSSKAELVRMKIEKGDALVIASDGLCNDPCVKMRDVQEIVRRIRCSPNQLAEGLSQQTLDRGTPPYDTTIVCLTRLQLFCSRQSY